MLRDFPLFAYFPAKDMKRARAFYEEKLGCRVKGELGGGVAYEFGGGTGAFLYPTPNAGTNQASQAYWQVTGIEKLVTDLRARGVEFERYDQMPGEHSVDGLVVNAGGAKAAWFKDTEGNILALIEDVTEEKAKS